jgi:hypothetical protein
VISIANRKLRPRHKIIAAVVFLLLVGVTALSMSLMKGRYIFDTSAVKAAPIDMTQVPARGFVQEWRHSDAPLTESGAKAVPSAAMPDNIGSPPESTTANAQQLTALPTGVIEQPTTANANPAMLTVPLLLPPGTARENAVQPQPEPIPMARIIEARQRIAKGETIFKRKTRRTAGPLDHVRGRGNTTQAERSDTADRQAGGT